MESAEQTSVADASRSLDLLRDTIQQAMVGQSAVLDQVLIALVA